jgi:hypothetical protein
LRQQWPGWTKVAALAAVALIALALAGCGKGGGNSEKTQQVRAGLSDLTSYKCTLKIEGNGGPLADLENLFSPPSTSGTPVARAGSGTVGFEATVTYIKPDKSQMTVKAGNDSFSQTTIGKQQWATLGGLTVGPNSVGTQSANDLSLCNSFWDGGFADATNSFQCTSKPEKVNGRDTLKCTIDKASFDQIRAALGGVLNDTESGIRDLTKFQLALWVTDGAGGVPGGLPVRFQADMGGKDTSNKDFAMTINMNLTNLNDKKLAVTAPGGK